jgi:hypothetical protein
MKVTFVTLIEGMVLSLCFRHNNDLNLLLSDYVSL